MDYDLGPSIFWFFLFCSFTLNLLLKLILNRLNFFTAVVGKFILSSSFFINLCQAVNFIGKLLYLHVWDIVIACKLLSIVGLSTCRRSCNENLDWLKTTISIELSLKHADLAAHTESTVPGECFLLLQFFHFLFLKLLLLSSKRDRLERL